jgi:excisionase family DNA binding protein
MPKFMDVKEVAEYLRVSPKTVYRMIDKNRIPAIRVGKLWRFDAEAIDKWLQRKSNPYTPE